MTLIRQRQYNLDHLPQSILTRLKEMQEERRFRLRTILVRNSDGEWTAPIVVLQAFLTNEEPQIRPSLEFDGIILHERWLLSKEAIEVLHEINDGVIKIADRDIPLKDRQQWSLEHLSARNDYQTHSGVAASLSLPESKTFPDGALLNAQEGIYLPDADTIIRYWVPFTTSHGTSDGRLGGLHILLPEERAAFVSVLSRGDCLDIACRGDLLKVGVQATAAVRIQTGIVHVSQLIKTPKTSMDIPADAHSWDLLLHTEEGEFLDAWGSRSAYSITRVSSESDLHATILAALDRGENLHTEFKPLIALPPDKRREKYKSPDKEKFRETLETIAAMANAEGGQVFLGITDRMELEREGAAVRAWADGELNEENLARYGKALQAKLNDRLILHAPLSLATTIIDGAPVVTIAVARTPNGQTAGLQDDSTFWVRRAATNKSLHPSEWNQYQRQITDMLF